MALAGVSVMPVAVVADVVVAAAVVVAVTKIGQQYRSLTFRISMGNPGKPGLSATI